MTLFRASLVLALACGFTACQEEKKTPRKDGPAVATSGDATKRAPKGFLTAADLKAPTDVEVMKAEDVTKEINALTTLFNESPSEDDADASSCFQRKQDAMKTKIVDGYVVIDGEADYSDCYAEPGAASENMKVTNAKMRMMVVMSCEGENLASLEGKTLAELSKIEDTNLCKDSKRRSVLMNTKFTMSVELDLGGDLPKMTYDTISLGSQMRADGTPCVETPKGGDVWLKDDCVNISKTTYANVENVPEGTKLESRYERVDYLALEAAKDDRYYRAGKLRLDINGWKGEAVYSGKDAKPTWSLSRGDETKTGTFEYRPRSDD